MSYSLSSEFLDLYRVKTPDWGPLGWETYKRTYARWMQSEFRYEEWWETCKRVIEGNFNLIPNDPTFSMKEMETAYDLMFYLIWLPPGRGLWVSGTEFSKSHGDALVNCWFVSCRPQPYFKDEETKVSFPFVFIFDVSMKGGGSGFTARKKDVDLIPEVEKNLNLFIECHPSHPDFEINVEASRLDYSLVDKAVPNDGLYIQVEDSREGWCEALSWVIDCHFNGMVAENLIIDVSNIRGYGEDIKGFGGKASGPRSLIELLRGTNSLLNLRAGKKISAVDVTDMMNMIGRCVIAGNVRRTAQLSIGDYDNSDFLAMKDFTLVDGICQKDEQGSFIWQNGKRVLKPMNILKGLYSEKELSELIYTFTAQSNHRWSSNNSLMITPEFNNWEYLADKIKINGEPGYVNEHLIRNYGRLVDGFNPEADPDAEGTNACGEVTLANGEPCNLVENFPSRIRKAGRDYNEVMGVSTRYAYRVTHATSDWEVSRDIISKNRRIGVSLSGIQDWVLEEFDGEVFTGWKNVDGVVIPIGVNPEVTRILGIYYDTVKQAAIRYALALGTNIPIKFTTVKPSGTISLLVGASPGMHWHYFDYGIRRVRFQMDDLLLKILAQAGYYMEPDVKVPNTMVVEFPVKANTAEHPKFRCAGQVPMYEQFAFQALLAEYWADNAVSCTVTFQPEEADQIEGLLKYYSTKIKSTTCLPYKDHGYLQAPYEPYVEKDGKSPKQQYEEAMSKIIARPVDIYSQSHLVDRSSEELDMFTAPDCIGGSCPVR